MTNDPDKPIVHRSQQDLFGYNTRRPFRDLAEEMAEDALAGRHKGAVDAELAAVRKLWRHSTDD